MTATLLPADWAPAPPNPKKIRDVASWRDFVARRNEHPVPPPLTRDDYEALPTAQRRLFNLVRRDYVSNLPKHDTPMAAEVRDRIETTLSVNTFNRDPGPRPGMFLSAKSGLGKSTLIRDIAACHEEDLQTLHQIWTPPTPPPGECDDLRVPIVWINVPAKVSIRSLCLSIIRYYGESFRVKDTEANLTERVAELFDDCQTRLLVLDDITRLKMHREADQDASDWIRFLQETSTTVLGVGINVTQTGLLYEGQASAARRDLLTQTRRRFTVYELDPFTYDTTEDADAWINHLRAVEHDLPLLDKQPGMLIDDLMAEYLFERTAGVIGTLSKALTEAASNVIGRSPQNGGETITYDDIARIRLDHAAEDNDTTTTDLAHSQTTSTQPRTQTTRKRTPNGVYGKPVRPEKAAS